MKSQILSWNPSHSSLSSQHTNHMMKIRKRRAVVFTFLSANSRVWCPSSLVYCPLMISCWQTYAACQKLPFYAISSSFSVCVISISNWGSLMTLNYIFHEGLCSIPLCVTIRNIIRYKMIAWHFYAFQRQEAQEKYS